MPYDLHTCILDELLIPQLYTNDLLIQRTSLIYFIPEGIKVCLIPSMLLITLILTLLRGRITEKEARP